MTHTEPFVYRSDGPGSRRARRLLTDIVSNAFDESRDMSEVQRRARKGNAALRATEFDLSNRLCV